MFKEEYPERYDEIGDLLVKLITEAHRNVYHQSSTLVGKYYEVLEDIMKLIRERMKHLTIEGEIKPMLLGATDLSYISPDAELEQKLKGVDGRSFIIHFITELVVDRMIADNGFLT